MPTKVAPSIIHAITCLSLHPSNQTMKTKATKAKLVRPHERLWKVPMAPWDVNGLMP